MPFPLTFAVEKNVPCPTYRTLVQPNSYIMQSRGRETQVQKRFFNPLITLPKELQAISIGCHFLAIFLHFVSLIFRLLGEPQGLKRPETFNGLSRR
jgi:hypothetical protein